MQIFVDESKSRQSTCNSSYMLDEDYVIGVVVLSKYVEQRDRLKVNFSVYEFY